MAAPTVAAHEHLSVLGLSAGNKFREVQRSTENPTTKALAEGLTHLSEAVKEMQSGTRTPGVQDQESSGRLSVRPERTGLAFKRRQSFAPQTYSATRTCRLAFQDNAE